jgi:hypothetical protein
LQSCYILFMNGLGFLFSLLAPEPLPCDHMGSLEAMAAPWKLAALVSKGGCLKGHSTWKKTMFSFIACPPDSAWTFWPSSIRLLAKGPRAFLGRGETPLGLAKNSRHSEEGCDSYSLTFSLRLI